MGSLQFINVYSGRSPQDTSAELTLWNVYLVDQENVYLIQKLDDNNNPTQEKYKISPTFFGVNFRQINNIPLKSKTKKNVHTLQSKSMTDDLLKKNSPVHSSSASKKTDKRRTGEFFFQLSAHQPQAIQKKSDKAPKSNLSAQKTTNEFQLNLGPVPKKKKSVNDFGLSSLLNTITKSNKKNSGNSLLTISAQNIDDSQNTKTKPKAVPNPFDAPSLQDIPTKQHIGNVIIETSHGVEEIAPAEQNASPHTSNDIVTKTELNTVKKILPKDKITETDEALLLPKESKGDFAFSEKALKLDKSLRAEFQVSLSHWNCARKNLAKHRFAEILNRQAQYVPAHKHMFTDFAIKLRKINLHDLALQYATKSTTLSPDDSHAFFNVARLYYELGRYEKANDFINKSLELEEDLAPALRLSYIIKECIRRKAINR